MKIDMKKAMEKIEEVTGYDFGELILEIISCIATIFVFAPLFIMFFSGLFMLCLKLWTNLGDWFSFLWQQI